MAMRERRKRIYRKLIPYGMQNFEDVIEKDCYYVDKTPFIEDIEESNMYFFYIHPRRFGKSLTLSMLENYYVKFGSFCSVYAHLLPSGIKEELREQGGAVEQLSFLCQKVNEAGQEIRL